jgi:hypothetical protein
MVPSSALYWHMGETTMRFASSSERSEIGEKSFDGMGLRFLLEVGEWSLGVR